MLKSALTVLAVAGLFGSGAPADPVATVDGQAIERQAFDHWMTVAARSLGGASAQVPDPTDDYRGCVAAKRKAMPPKQRRKITDKRLRAQCRREYAQLRGQVMQLLISFRWIEGEAALRGLTVTDAEVAAAFQQQKAESFPDDAAFQKFLRTSGQTEADIFARVRLDLLADKIRDYAFVSRGPITAQTVQQYYDQHRSSFVEPQKRTVRIVVTRRRATAERARAALERGASWSSVVRRYSIDGDTWFTGGRLPPLSADAVGNAFEQNVFSARKGRLVGPVRVGSRFYLFKVTKIERERQLPLDKVKTRIRDTLRTAALEAFIAEFTARWRAKTECAEGFRSTDCRNGPGPTPDWG
jgi:foldase protein PrsA